MSKFTRVIFIIAILAMAGAAIMQVFFPDYDAVRTGFGLAPGWQREIGFWNIAMIIILVGTLLNGDKNTVKIVSYGAFALGFLLGTNHLLGFISTQKSINLVGAIENYLLILLLLIAIILDKKFVNSKAKH